MTTFSCHPSKRFQDIDFSFCCVREVYIIGFRVNDDDLFNRFLFKALYKMKEPSFKISIKKVTRFPLTEFDLCYTSRLFVDS